jgi:excisionase family DNA binding protein
MTAAMEQHTVLPPEDPTPGLAALAALLHQPRRDQRAKLVGPDGSQYALPDEVYQVLRDVAAALANGLAITIAPHNTLLTTQEAADMLSISRPTLVRLLTDGLIPFEHRGRHRRVRLADVIDYQQHARNERHKALDEMAATASDDGTYDIADGFIETR